MNDRAVSVVVSWMRRRTRISTQATTSPTAMPPTDSRTNSMPTSRAVTDPPMATIAVRRMVMAVASLNSDSPSRMVTTRRGSPIRRATAVAATASGGATTAPRAIAAENGMPMSHQVTRPTPAAVKTTRPTDNRPMTFLLAPRSTSEVRMAVA